MKTPIDNATAGATLALLDSGDDFQMVDLWAVTLNGGAVIRWHGAGVSAPLSFAGQTWLPGPGIDRGKITTKLGVEVATLDVSISATPADLLQVLLLDLDRFVGDAPQHDDVTLLLINAT